MEESIGFAAGDDEVVQRKKTPKASSYAQVSNLSMAFSDDPEAGVSERNKVTLKESSESGEVESIEAGKYLLSVNVKEGYCTRKVSSRG